MPTLRFRLDDVPDGGMRRFEVDGRKVLVTRDGEEVRAFDAICPHAGADLGKGVRCGARVVCPWHHGTFDASDGHLIEPPPLHGLTRFAVREEEGTWHADLNAEWPRPAAPPRGPGNGHTVIVGGGAAGFMAARTLRAGGYQGRVTVLTREARSPYDRTALSKGYLAGKKDAGELPLGGPVWLREHGVELRENTEVEALEHGAHRLRLQSGENLSYSQVIVATGSEPRRLDVPGADLPGVHVLRSFRDARELREAVRGRRLVIVGSSFIGLEAAASLVGEGGAAAVTVVGREAEVLAQALTPRVGRALRRMHEQRGVQFHLGREPERLEGQGQVEAVLLQGGGRLEADVVLVGIGVDPRTDLLADLRDERGAVPTDAQMRAAPGVYAAGDIALAPTVLGRLRAEHWRVAEQQGMVAAQSILDAPELEPMSARVPFFWTQQYGQSLRYVGHAEGLDDTWLWGEPEELDFIEFTFGEGRTVAASGMGRDAELAAFEELLRRGRAPSPEEIRAGEFSLANRLTG